MQCYVITKLLPSVLEAEQSQCWFNWVLCCMMKQFRSCFSHLWVQTNSSGDILTVYPLQAIPIVQNSQVSHLHRLIQTGWGPEQSAVGGGVPAHGGGLELDGFKTPLNPTQPNPIYASIKRNVSGFNSLWNYELQTTLSETVTSLWLA